MRCSPRSQTERREALPALLAMPRAAHERSTHRAGAEGSETRKDVAGLGLLTIVKRGEKLVRSRLHGLELLLSLLPHLW